MIQSTRCLKCYQDLEDRTYEYHPACSRKMFGVYPPPEFPLDLKNVQQVGKRLLIGRVAVTGVQPKLSLDVERIPGTMQRRFTIMNLAGDWGDYILKPPFEAHPSLPENEDLSMHLASIAGITVAEHSLIRMHSGELAYVTRRFDRSGRGAHRVKFPMEDMCQLTGRLTENKYDGSLEQVGKAIKQFSDNWGLDHIRFFALNLFCYLTGNGDMHLKNFSIVTKHGMTQLSPAYDLVASHLVLNKSYDTALTINGKHNNATRNDWNTLARGMGINEKSLENIYRKIAFAIPRMIEVIPRSFLNHAMQDKLVTTIQERSERLGIVTAAKAVT